MTLKELETKVLEEIGRVEKEFVFNPADVAIQPKDVAKYIDHTVLKATTTPEEIKDLCKEAMDNHFFSVCVNPAYVSLAKECLVNSDVKIATVIGFPLGMNDTTVKSYETQMALEDGANEFDMVINIGMLKSKRYDFVYEDIKNIVEEADGNVVKVIIETCYLTKEEKIAACALSKLAGAHFVKTSTGFGSGGATAEDVALMKFVVGKDVKVKASGGVRDFDTAKAMIAAGAERIGTSSGAKIMAGEVSTSAY